MAEQTPPTVVVADAENPIPAAIIEDKRNTSWQRISIVGLILVLLVFVVRDQVISSANNDLLHRAATQRTTLIDTNQALAKKITALSQRQVKDGETTRKLYRALLHEAKVLRALGASPAQVRHALGPFASGPPPGIAPSPGGGSPPGNNGGGTHHPSSSPSPSSQPPSPTPSPQPSSPSPTPPPGPVKCVLKHGVVLRCIPLPH